ncbi:hypothetical protein ANO14919_006660 [Xylariales sp. No.14919]|nr:hypothetical protein ANO14919_006660 [Xylariales sp. No.14919]
MSTLNQETRPTAHPEAVSSRRLFKGRLSPPAAQPTRKSYTLAPASISEVFIKDPAEKQATSRRSTAISSRAVPQPFVDPAALERGPTLS